MGAEAFDQRLQGGLTRAGLHEFCAAEPDDAAATSGFVPLLSLRCAASKLLIWVRECRCEDGDGRLRAPGLEELGATLHDLVLVTAPDAFAVLRLFRHC